MRKNKIVLWNFNYCASLQKMIRITFILFMLMSLTFNGYAQTYIIAGKVYDSENRPVKDARIYFKNNSGNKVYTNANGKFFLKQEFGKYDSLKIEHVAFLSYSKFIGKKNEKRVVDDTLFLTIFLTDKTLPIVDIVAKSNLPDTLFGTQEYSVEDFEFDKNGNLVLLTYEKNLKSGSVLRLVGSENKILDNFFIDEEAIELQTDFRKNIHLITSERVYLIQVVSQQFEVYLEDRDYYFRYVAPVLDTIDQCIYFSNYSEIYPAFDYFEFNRTDSVFNKLLSVEDELMMEMYRAEFKYVDNRTKLWAHQKQIETGIDKEIWVGATYFTGSPYYTPLYAPLFKIGADSLVVFDHYSNYLFLYRPEHGKVDSTYISYHKDARKSGWQQPLIQDEKNGLIYAIFQRNGYTYLYRINLKTGVITEAFKLYFKYVERIKIVDNEVFYVYRPFETLQKKYIYREKLE